MFLRKIAELCNKLYNRFQIHKNGIRCGKLGIFGRICVQNRNGAIRIGSRCVFNSGKGHNLIGGDTVCRLVVDGGYLQIGDRVGISNSTIVSRKKVVIEDDVFIGGSCKIYDHDFHPIDYKKRIMFLEEIQSAPVVIKKGAFIGAHTIILKGVTVGERAVIGAGSVVTRDIPEDEIWAGNPVQFIKRIAD